jgi:hypothetical protein
MPFLMASDTQSMFFLQRLCCPVCSGNSRFYVIVGDEEEDEFMGCEHLYRRLNSILYWTAEVRGNINCIFI